MADLVFLPYSEFQRIINLPCPSIERTKLFATLCRINTLYMITLAGSGHIGSSFSSLDIVSWLFLNEIKGSKDNEDFKVRDIYFSSKGHDVPGLYSVLIGLGLLDFDYLHRLRRVGGLPGHPDISTPFIETNTGSLGMGISKAKGMAIANRLQGKIQNIYVMTGDGELQEGQFWESLPTAVHRDLGEITVIVDHNKIQSDTWVSQINDLGDLEKKLSAFGWYVARCNGHDYNELASCFLQFKTIKEKPKILIADTVKGQGVSFMTYMEGGTDEALYRFHSGAPDEQIYAQAIQELIDLANDQLCHISSTKLNYKTISRPNRSVFVKPQQFIPAYSKALLKQAELNPRIIVLDSDLMVDCGLLAFKKRFPDRFIECGIAEQDMVSQAGGMALKGLLPIVHSFSCFLSTRPNEQIYNNASEKKKIVYIGSLAGILPGGPGHSHQSVRDISALSAIPGLILIEPSSELELNQAFDFCLNKVPESCYLRLVSIPYEIPYEFPDDYQLEFGKGFPLTEGKDAILFGYGPILLSEAYKAAKSLTESHGIKIKVINLPWLNYINIDWLKEIVKGYGNILTLDNHYIVGGQGDLISAKLAEIGLPEYHRIIRIGLTEFPAFGQNSEVLRYHRMDANSLVERIVQLLPPRK